MKSNNKFVPAGNYSFQHKTASHSPKRREDRLPPTQSPYNDIKNVEFDEFRSGGGLGPVSIRLTPVNIQEKF